MKERMMRRLFLLGCGIGLTGCANGKGFLSGFIPSVEFERLEVIDIDFEHVETDFIFNIDNPNPVGFRICLLYTSPSPRD